MICHRCLRQSLRRQTFTSTRGFATSPLRAAAPSPATAPSADKPNSTSASAAAQPFTTPPAISPASRGLAPQPKKNAAAVLQQSSCPAGTPLKGLNFLKGKDDPVAMEDSAYPDWLWEVLRAKKQEEGGVDGDLFSKSRSKRQKALKRAKKAGLANPESLMPRIPLHEQTVDLPAGDGTLEGTLRAGEAREDLTKAMRIKRRAVIKETNFLKTMS